MVSEERERRADGLLFGGMQAEVGAEAEHHLPGGVAVVGYLTVEDGILDGVFDSTNLAAGSDAEGVHDILTRDGRLEVAYAVALLQLDELALDELEVGLVLTYFLGDRKSVV